MIARAFRWIAWAPHRITCLILGHEFLMHLEPNRLALRCEVCGYETPGWTIGTEPRRPVIVRFSSRPHPVSDRAA